MDHNYCIPGSKDHSEQVHAGLDIVHKMEQDDVLLNLPENIEKATKQDMTSPLIDGVLQDIKMGVFSVNIEPNCKDFVSSKQTAEHVKSIDHEANIQEFSYSPQHDKGFKMDGDSLNEEFISDGYFEKSYSIEHPDASNKEFVISPQTVRNRISIKTEPDNENIVSAPQQCDELIKMDESEATSVVFVGSLQIGDSANDQSENTSETLVNWSQPLQVITKVNHNPQGGTGQIELGPSAIADFGSETPYTCSICGKIFNTQAVMMLHIAQFHHSKLIFKCYVCGKAFDKRSSLNKHNLTHIKKCGVCGQNVIWLSLHMLNHTGERPHRCWVCQKVFIATANSNTGSSNLISTNENGFYNCDICEKEIRSWQYFTLHMKKHTLTQTHLTCVCHTTHGSSSDTNILMTHTKNASHKCVEPLEEQGKADVNNVENPCSFCDHRFRSQFEHHLHLLNHFKGKFQDCSVCVHGFASEELLLKHVISHIESSMYDSCAYVIGVQKKKQSVILDKKTWGTAVNFNSKQGLNQDTVEDPSYEQPRECDVSQKGINTKRNISEHLSIHTEEQPDKCGICGKVFIQKDHLRAHMLTHTTQRPYKCHVCGKDFAEKCFLETHLLTHPGERPYQSGICGKQFATKNNLKIHMFTHTGERPHKCGVCAKGFTLNVDLTRHMLAHTGELPHKCSVCGKGFTVKGSIANHMLIHTGERPHTCGICGKGFIKKIALTNHMMTHTGECRYTCGVCRKGFRQKNALTYHILTHTGERPYKCVVCGNGFRSKSILTNHMLTHTGERPHKCSVCGKGFRSKSNLSGHSFTHNKGRWRKGFK